MQKEELIKFEEEIAEIFNSGKIKAPVKRKIGYFVAGDHTINVY